MPLADRSPRPESLIWATEIDVLPVDAVVTRAAGGYLTVRTPSNPRFYWGNYLIFDRPPQPGDGERWEAAFTAEFAGTPEVRHRTFAWDARDGGEGAAEAEFAARGYELERQVALVAAPSEVLAHPRANREVEIRVLDPAPGADQALWDGVLAVRLANNDPEREPLEAYEPFVRSWLRDQRRLFEAGLGAWYAAVDPTDETVVAGCGIVATGPRGRYRTVDTHPAHRRRGICRRLVAVAAAHAAATWPLETLVIVADPDDHALGIYESLGFRARERATGAMRRPPSGD